HIPAGRAACQGGGLGPGGGGDRVVAQMLVDDAGPDVGHLGPLGELVDDEGVELLVVGHRDVEQEILAAAATGSGRAPWWGRRRPRRPDPGWSADPAA